MNRKQSKDHQKKFKNLTTESLPEKHEYKMQPSNIISATPVKIVSTISIFLFEFKFINYKIL